MHKNMNYALSLQLLSSGLSYIDIDDDDDHIFGFALESIRKEARRASRLVCTCTMRLRVHNLIFSFFHSFHVELRIL